MLHYIDYMNWTQIIKRMDRAGLTFQRIAEESGISKRALIDWHGGKRKPDPHKWEAFIATIERLDKSERRAGK